jgi:hypothetical protein
MKLGKGLLASLSPLVLALTAGPASAAIVLYSYDFNDTGALNGKAADTSGATVAQHAQYGTINGETWTASTLFQADGTYTAATNPPRESATLSFTPQSGYVYTLSYTTNFAGGGGWQAGGFFATNNWTGDVLSNGNGLSLWGLTTGTSQSLFADPDGGTGDAFGGQVVGGFDTSAPATLTFRLDTTGGTDNWSAEWLVSGTSRRTVADLGAFEIESVGIGALYTAANTAAFQSFELSVIPEPSSAMLVGLAGLSILTLRRRR